MAIAHVQSVINNSWSASSPGTASVTSVGSGHSLIMSFALLGSPMGSASSVVDSTGDSWVKLAQTNGHGYNFQDSEVWWLPSASHSGTHTLTVTYSGTPYGAADTDYSIDEFSGVGSVDVAAVYATGTATTYSVTTATASATGDLAYVVGISPLAGKGATTYPASPWTNVNNANGASSMPAWQVMPSTTAVTASWTLYSSFKYDTIAILFKASVASSPTPLRTRHPFSQAVNRAANWMKRESGLWSPESGLIPREA